MSCHVTLKVKKKNVRAPDMSIGLDLNWTGSGLGRILLILDWIRAVKCFINLGSGLDLD